MKSPAKSPKSSASASNRKTTSELPEVQLTKAGQEVQKLERQNASKAATDKNLRKKRNPLDSDTDTKIAEKDGTPDLSEPATQAQQDSGETSGAGVSEALNESTGHSQDIGNFYETPSEMNTQQSGVLMAQATSSIPVVTDAGSSSLLQAVASSVGTGSGASATAGIAAGTLPAAAVVAAAALAAVAIGNSSPSNPADKTAGAVPRTYSISAMFGPATDQGVGTQIYLYKASNGEKLGTAEYSSVTGKFEYIDREGYTGVVIAILVDTDNDPDYMDEATGKTTDIDGVHMVVIEVTGTGNIQLNINPLTTAAALKMGVTATEGDAAPSIPVELKQAGASALISNVNKAIAKVFGIVDKNKEPLDIATSDVVAVIDANGSLVQASNAYGRALAIVSQAENASGKNTAAFAKDIAAAVNITDGRLDNSVSVTASVQKYISEGITKAKVAGQMTGDQALDIAKSSGTIATGKVSISGDVKEGGTLTAVTSGISDPDGTALNFSYQWQIANMANGTYSDIANATSSTYQIASDQSQVGKFFKVVVKATNDGSVGGTSFSSDVVTSIAAGGQLSAGQAIAGITITASLADGTVVAETLTKADGSYKLQIDAKYAGQKLLLKAFDTTADGQGYTDEASGEAKDFSVTLRAMLTLGTSAEQKAQISTATELATRVAIADGENLSNVSEAAIQAANKAVADFLGVDDIVDAENPDIVGSGDTRNNTSDAYGKGLALLSGMDSVAERSGASNATDSALSQLAKAFTLVNGSVSTDFNDPELLNLLSQAVTEVAQTQGSELAKDLADVALNAISTSTPSTSAPLAFFMTSDRNLIGDGKTATVQFHFDTAPTEAQLTQLAQDVIVTGGELDDLIVDNSDSTGLTYKATFIQSGTEAPQIRVTGTDYFANDVSMALDNTAPTLSIARMEGLEGDGASGVAKSTLKAGDTLRVTLTASEAVNVTEGGILQLRIGGETVNATYNSAKSGTRSLVFDYTVGNNLNDSQGVAIVGLTDANITDRAENQATDLNLGNYYGLPVYVDTTAPVVLAQVPIDNSIVGNAGVHSISLSFGEAVGKGSAGTLTLNNAAGTPVASWNAADGTISSDERAISYNLPTSLATLPAGNYTIKATGSPVIDKAGNAISTSAMASDGTWSFTVGAVSIGINKVGGDNLLNANDLESDITISGNLSGDGSTSVTAADMQVWFRPIGGGAAVQAKVTSLANGAWSATLDASDAASLQGGYVVKVNIDATDVQASATSALLVDTQAQITLGAMAGDNKISLVEQSIINSGKNLSYSFVAEKGSSGSITFKSTTDVAKTVSKTFTNAKGNSPDSVTLSKDDLIKLGTGNFTVEATATDGAGNTNTVSRNFSIEAPAAAAQISGITLQGSRSGTLIHGDTLTATVNFDKAVTVSNAASLKLAIDVGDTTRQADFAGISADRKQLMFSYKVLAEDADSDGVALTANALQLGSGTSKAVINDVSSGTAATTTSAKVDAVATLKVDGSITNTPADLDFNVIEAGLTAANTPTAGKAAASGKLLSGSEITDGKTVAKVQLGSNAEVTVTANGNEVQGQYGKWLVKSDGSYSYTLDNVAANSLKAGDKPNEALKVWITGANDPVTATVTIQGSNDAPTVSTAITQAVTESNTAVDPISINLLQGANDVDAGEINILRVTDLTYKVGTGVTSTKLPAGLSLSSDGKTLSVDPTNAAFDSLAQGMQQLIVVRYKIKDAQGATVDQEAQITITGTNDAPTVKAALTQNATEGAGLTSINLLQGASDVDTGDTLSVSNVTYNVAGSATADSGKALPAGISLGADGLLRLDTRHPDYNSLKAGESKVIVASYTVSDSKGGSVAQTATFTLTGTNDAPQVNTAKTLLSATVTAGGNVSYDFDADAFTDLEGDSLNYSATLADGSALPDWLAFIKDTRSFSGTAPASSTASQLSIKVTASDDTASTSQTFTLAISPSGAPVATVDTANVTESGIDASGSAFAGEASATGNVLRNDTNADGTSITVIAADVGTTALKAVSASSTSSSNATTLAGSYGSLQLGADGSYSYTLNNTATATQRLKAGQVANDVFTYQLKDSNGQMAQSQLVVQVTGSNDAPIVNTSIINNTTDSPVFILAAGKAFAYVVPAALFTDPDADTLSLNAQQVTGSSTTEALPSWLQFDPVTRTVSGTPPEGTTASTTVRITAKDGKGGTASQDITLNLTQPEAPSAVADSANVIEAGVGPTGVVVGQAIATGNVLSNDSRSASSFSVTSADVGAVTGSTDLKAVNASSTSSSNATTLTGTYGSLLLGADGSYRYQLDNVKTNSLKIGESKSDTFTYELTDSTGQKARTQLTINVTGSNDAPILTASNGSRFISQAVTETNNTATSTAAPISINLLQGASDLDGVDTTSETTTLSVTDITYQFAKLSSGVITYGALSSTPPPGLTLSTDGKTLSIDPAHAAFNSLAQSAKLDIVVSYLIKDVNGASVAQKATITVTGTNDAPTVSTAITQAVTESNTTVTPTSINLLQGASDVDTGDFLSVTGITYKVGNTATGNNGEDLPAGLTLSADGKTLSVDPTHTAFNSLKAGATQTITASYSVSDDKGGSVPQTATITVTGTNDAPTAVGSIGSQSAATHASFSLDVSSAFTDADAGDTASYSLSDVGATGLSIDENGVITGTYTSTRDAQDVTVTRTDGSGEKATQTFSLRVVDRPAVQSFTVTDGTDTNTNQLGKAGEALTFTVKLSETVTTNAGMTAVFTVNGQEVSATAAQVTTASDTITFTGASVPETGNGSVIALKSITGATITGSNTQKTLADIAPGAIAQSTTAPYAVDNAAPNITTTGLSIAEGTTDAGILTATDSTSVKWTLTTGGTDNSKFQLTEAGVISFTDNSKPDYESSVRSYSIQVKATDAVGLSSEKTLTVQVTDVNEAPTSLALENTVTTLEENTSTTSRIKVADIAITDDALGTNTLTLDGTDKALFEIDAGVLYLKAGTVLNYESDKTAYDVTVKAQDNALTGSTALSKDFRLSVSNVNEAPVASTLATQTIAVGQTWAGFTVPAFTDPEENTLSYTATLADGSPLPSWLSFDSNTRSFSIKDGSSTNSLSAASLSVKITANDGQLSTSANFNLNVTTDTTPPTASTVTSEAPRSYDRGVLQGTLADTVMLRFSESVSVDDIKTAMAAGQINLKNAAGETRNLGTGATFDANAPGVLELTGFGSGADGIYKSTFNGTSSPTPLFAKGFGLSNPDNFSVNTSTPIYTRTTEDGINWYIWQQNGLAPWIVSQISPVDDKGNVLPWFLASITSNSDPAQRTAVLGVSGWSAKSGALVEGTDHWANASKLSSANIETQGYGRTFLLALGKGSNAQAGDVLVIDKGAVKDVAGNAASSDVQFTLPADITRPAVSASTPAALVGLDAQGNPKTNALTIGDKVRVTLTMTEPVSVSSNADPSVNLLMDTATRQASINRAESFKNGATTSTTLVFDYVVKEGDLDGNGGIQVGAFNRNNSNITDAAGNRFTAPTDLAETSNTIRISADSMAPTLASISVQDRGVINSGAVADTLIFKFNEPAKVDQLEEAFASGKVKVTNADGTVTRTLGAGATVEATYPSEIVVTGFSAAANGSYTSLWSPAQGKNLNVPSFTGFAYVAGSPLTPDSTYPIYKHTDSTTDQEFYFWRPSGYAGYVLTPVSSEANGAAQTWWSVSSSQTTVSDESPREGVLLAADWYARSGTSTSATKLSTLPGLEATGLAFTYSLSFGTGNDVQQGDKLVIDKSAVADALGNANSTDLVMSLPADITRPVLGTAVVKAYKNNWDNSTQTSTYTETSSALGQHDLIRVEIPVNEPIKLYYSGGSTGSVALDIGGQTRYAYLNMALSSADGSTGWGFSSNKLVYEYWIQAGDNDTQGGITVGAMSRGSVGIYDAAGNRPVTPVDVAETSNNISVVDNTSPSLWISYASGNKVVLAASEKLDANAMPDKSAFSVSVDGKALTIDSVALTSNGTSLVLTLASGSALTVGQYASVSYTKPSSGAVLQDLAGNSANSMPNYSITASTAPTIQFAQASVDLIEVAGMSELWFEVKYSDLVAISGTPRLALTLTALDGSTSTVYADYQPYSGNNYGQNTVGFAYKPAANAQGQVHVNSLDLNGGSITAYGSVGTVPASTTLNGSEFFTPYTWIYPSLINSVTGDAGNNLLAPWWADPATTPKTLTSTTVTAGEGGRDVLAMTVLLPDTVNSAQAAAAYRLDYQVTTEGARQVKLMHGTDVVDTYTVPANGNWPNGVEQLLFAGVYKDSAGKVQMAEMNQIRLTVAQAEYTDPANSNDRWIQGTLNADYINLSARDTVQKISVNTEQGNDTIVGHDGVDIIRAGGGTNTISAGAGNDILVISNGSQDLMDGGEGTDILRFELAGNNKKVTVDADGKMYVYSATGTWTNGFSLDSNGWVARYRISSDYGTDGTNRIGVYDIALERVVATVKNVEQLQWRLDDNLSERATNTLKVGTSGDDTLSGADVVLAGAGNDTITLNSNTLRISDWRNGTRPVLIDGGSGRDVLTLDSTSFYGHLNQVFENNTSNNINASRVIKNIEGLKFTGSTNNTVLLSAADITNLYAAGNTNTNVWSEIINSPDKRQFKIDGAVGLNITDTNGWTLQTNTVSYGGVTYKIADHSSGVQLILDSRIGISGALSNGGFSGGATVPSTTSPTSLSISSAATNGQITEGNAGTTDVTFTVTRSGDTTGATSVNWSLVNSSTDSNDFVTGQATSGTVNFTAGQTSLTITIQVQGDTTAEQNESFSVKLSNAVGASLGFAQTQVVINNDDGQATGTGPAPKVELVRAESGPIVSPGSSLRFVVELDQSVQVIGTPRLVLTLTDPTGAQSAKTVYANFQPYSDTTNGIWNHQSSMAFSYNYAEQDAVGAGWTYHIQGLENFNGSSIKSVEGNSLNVAADLTLNNVAITSGTWLYTSDVNGTTGTANNDLIGAFDAAGTVPRSLSSTSADGGAGERDVVGIPVLLPSLVQTQVQASSYYLNYEVSTSNGAVTGRYIKVYQEGNSTAIDTYTLPLDRSTWPANVEGLGYFLQFKDSNGQIQDTDHPNDSLIFWKTSSTSTDAINDDITHQGSYLNDTIDLSSTDPSVRVLVRGNQGNDVITGHAGTDVINGDGGNDNINVGAGNDMVFLSAGVDTLAGGEGTDILAVYVKGQEAMPSFGADGKLQLLSALGTWSNNGFTTNTNGYRLDWTFDFDGQTGALLAQRAGSSEVSTASGFEKIRIYKDLYQVVQGETTDTFDVLVGTSGNDALNTTPYQGILHGLDGDDTINVVTPDTPVIMGGNGNDTIVFAAAYFADSGNSDGMLIHGGAGIDTLRLGTDVTGMDLSAPSANSGSMLRSIEAIDLTGGTSAGNSVTMTVAWMRDLTDLVNNTHSLTIQGDGNDRVNLLIADGWSLQTSSSQAGYSQYSTSKDGETLNLYVTSSILEGSRGVISA